VEDEEDALLVAGDEEDVLVVTDAMSVLPV
jgi:hypothetical protein